MREKFIVVFILGLSLAGLAKIARADTGSSTVVGCVDVTHKYHGLWYYTLQIQRTGQNEEGPVDQAVLTTPSEGTIAGGDAAVIIPDVEEIQESNALILVGRGLRVEISKQSYFEDTYAAKVTLKADAYNFQDVTYACHFSN